MLFVCRRDVGDSFLLRSFATGRQRCCRYSSVGKAKDLLKLLLVADSYTSPERHLGHSFAVGCMFHNHCCLECNYSVSALYSATEAHKCAIEKMKSQCNKIVSQSQQEHFIFFALVLSVYD